MKTLLLIFLFSTAQADVFERSAYVIGASAIYITYDYLMYSKNQWEQGTTEETVYRISQVMLLTGLAWYLAERFGWKTGVAFGALYFSWWFDAGYYLLYGRNSWHNEVERNKVKWAKHTPAGWFENPTSAKTLKKQMALGLTVSIAFIL